MNLYFRDNFFSEGKTAILNRSNDQVGEVELTGAAGSALYVFGPDGRKLYGGKFPKWSSKWIVTDGDGVERGILIDRSPILSKRYEYERYGDGVYEITSPTFSREYEVRDEKGYRVAYFERVNGWFEAYAYRLTAYAADIDEYEWVAVVLGMNEIQKRHNPPRR